MAARDFGENVAQERVESDSIRLYRVSLQRAGFHLTGESYHKPARFPERGEPLVR
jgi:hypothetical protein